MHVHFYIALDDKLGEGEVWQVCDSLSRAGFWVLMALSMMDRVVMNERWIRGMGFLS